MQPAGKLRATWLESDIRLNIGINTKTNVCKYIGHPPHEVCLNV